MSVFTDKQRNSIVLGVIVALACVIIYSLRELFNAFLGSIILYTLFKPMFFYLQDKISRIFSASIVIVSSFIIIVLPFFTLSYMVVNRLAKLKGDNFQLKALILLACLNLR